MGAEVAAGAVMVAGIFAYLQLDATTRQFREAMAVSSIDIDGNWEVEIYPSGLPGDPIEDIKFPTAVFSKHVTNGDLSFGAKSKIPAHHKRSNRSAVIQLIGVGERGYFSPMAAYPHEGDTLAFELSMRRVYSGVDNSDSNAFA